MFFGVHFGVRLFCKEAATVEKEYFIDTLFDLLNESDALEVSLLDLRADRRGLTVAMKDGTVFQIAVEEKTN